MQGSPDGHDNDAPLELHPPLQQNPPPLQDPPPQDPPLQDPPPQDPPPLQDPPPQDPPLAQEPQAAQVPPIEPPAPVRPTLDEVLAQYDASLPDAQARASHGRAVLEPAINASPVLKTMLERSIAEGYLDRFTFGNAPDGAGGSYSHSDKSINFNAGSFSSRPNLVFVLGHETQHALSLQGQRAPYDAALTAAIAVRAAKANDPTGIDAPRDYTDVVRGVVEGTRREEAQAHIGGFNALASYVRTQNREDRAPTLREMYEAAPGRMSDFIDVTGRVLKDYTLKPGLTRSPDGGMPLAEEAGLQNIERMKVNYADKFPGSFGDNGLLDYRNQALLSSWKEIHTAESEFLVHHSTLAMTAASQVHVDLRTYQPTEHCYKIDFAALGARPEIFKFPRDGVIPVYDTQFVQSTQLQGRQDMTAEEALAHARLSDPTSVAVVPRQEALGALGLLPAPSLGQRLGALFSRNQHAIDEPSVSVPDLREPPLLQQSKAALDKLGPNGGLPDRDGYENAAAALAAEAQKAGMTSIDHAVASKDGNRLIAVQGQDPAAPDARLTSVAIAEAVRQPAEESVKRLQETPVARTQEIEQPQRTNTQGLH